MENDNFLDGRITWIFGRYVDRWMELALPVGGPCICGVEPSGCPYRFNKFLCSFKKCRCAVFGITAELEGPVF